MSGAERHVRLVGIPVHQRTREQRVCQRAHFVIELEQDLAGIQIYDVLETVLMLAAFFRDETPCQQPFVGPRKVGDVYLNMMPVKCPNLSTRFEEY